MTALLLLALSAAPLEVRVLERDTPVRVHLEAARITCDGKPLASSVDAEAGAREVRVGELKCTQVVAEDGVAVTVKETKRKYGGQLRVSLQGGLLRLINVVDVEAYLPSVVFAEADASKPAALEAQAIVSRTFALTAHRRHANAGYHLCDLAHCQVYRGQGASSGDAEAAVKKTTNQVLLIGGIVLKPAFFHAACGGHTSTAGDVFGEDATGSAVSDVEDGAPRCKGPDLAWTFEVEKNRLAEALSVAPNGIAFEPLKRDSGGRILEVRSFGRRFSGQEFLSKVGRAFGWRSVRSLKFSTTETDTSVVIQGAGTGHGVGLCQLGARALAEKGVDVKGILTRYFPESQIKPAP
ncbi:MAG: SpoIID/LytB domain-containing protein [Archangium sp.]|nr:SpoIID/LytB domain-containing protein [Archangium sp.]MDP3155944.1 SpoIID/LytB domain-containing protein [Archangium sp.]MDP3576160.1 SpoIID/LytB domain-containing protein [Archangium sp.]